MSNILKGILNELSTEKLGQYKTAAAADAKKADNQGDYKRGDKRFSGIVRATKKQFANDEKQLKEFAPVGGDDREPNEEEILRQLASKWWNGTEQEMAKAQRTLEMLGWEIGPDESGDDDAGVYVYRIGDDDGRDTMAFRHSELELDEAYNNYHANRTGFARPKRDLGDEGEPAGMFTVMIDGRPWKEFTSNKAFSVAKTLATKNPTKRIQVKWPTGELNTVTEDELDENCWKGYHKEGNKELFGKSVPNCVKNEDVAEEKHSCPHCGGELVSEELMNEKKDACYYKVKSRYKVWPSAYASGALVKCRKKGASNWGTGGKKNESSILEGIEQVDENLHQWFKEKWVRFGPDGKIRGSCARGDDSEGKPKCLPQKKAQALGKKGRASAAARKRREDPNPERHGKAINVNTKKKSNEDVLDEKWSQKYKNSINCSNPKGFSQKAHCAGKKK